MVTVDLRDPSLAEAVQADAVTLSRVPHVSAEKVHGVTYDRIAPTLGIARELWSRYWAPLLGGEDVVLLGVYSHMIDGFMYLPDYPIGHMIARQVEEQMEKSGKLGPEFERICKTGNVAPDLWMQIATGRGPFA